MFPYTWLFVIDPLCSIDTETEAVLLELLLTVDTSVILTPEQRVSYMEGSEHTACVLSERR